MTPDLVYDEMIGCGRRRSVFSYGGNPGVGSLHRFRDAVENGWRTAAPHGRALARRARQRVRGGRLEPPVRRPAGLSGTGLAEVNEHVATVTCPFTGEELSAVRALRPDLAVIHAQQADRRGNVMLWGLVGVQKEAVLAAARALVTVEEVVTSSSRARLDRPPAWTVSAIAVVPGGAHPSYAAGYSTRDNDFYVAWDEISRDRERFRAWIESEVLGA